MNELGSHSGVVKVSNISGPDTVSIGTDLSKIRATFIYSVTKTKKCVPASILEQYGSTYKKQCQFYLLFYSL
jgi:hypothetical protein